MSEIFIYIFTLVLSIVSGLLLIPPIIYVCQVGDFMDEPDFRKKHSKAIPSLGGIAIVASLMTACILMTDRADNIMLWILGACGLMVTGVKDDLVRIPAVKRVIIQTMAVSLLIIPFWGDLKIESFYGFLGQDKLPVEVSVIFSLFVGLLLINSYNLIDGIDTLLGKITVCNAALLAAVFLFYGNVNFTVVSLALFGAIIAFLFYNWTPARIFMGDSGSLVIGFTMTFITFRLLSTESLVFGTINPAIFCIVISSVPMFDTLRLIVIRSIKGKSPFSPDRKHFHHILVDRGLSHQQASNKLLFYHTTLICIGLGLNYLGLDIHFIVLSTFFLFLGLSYFEKHLLNQYRRRKIIAFKANNEKVA